MTSIHKETHKFAWKVARTCQNKHTSALTEPAVASEKSVTTSSALCRYSQLTKLLYRQCQNLLFHVDDDVPLDDTRRVNLKNF